jgi:alpha-tubulin suppressor-like RCC1 family protein
VPEVTEEECFLRPLRFNFFQRNRITFVSCAYNHVIAVSSRGYAYSWGANKYYQLGLGFNSSYESKPRRITGSLETKLIKMVSFLFIKKILLQS